MKHEIGEGRYSLKKSKDRVEIYRRANERILPLISKTSDTQALDESVRMGLRYLDRMADAKKKVEEKQEKIEELQDEIDELKQKWETEEVEFNDI